MPTKIEWCDETINPLGHGCYGPGGTAETPNVCPYCYAKILAKRNMRGCELCKHFLPHTHFEQLDKLKLWKKPKNIFVQSMGDLFGEWVPDEWIKTVFEACEAAPRHRYLFLTENPKGYDRLPRILENCHDYWFGFTATNQDSFDERATEYEFYMTSAYHSFVSLEPLHKRITIDGVDEYGIEWVIIGAETGSRKDKVIPRREWIESIVEQCYTANVPVFMKNSLADIWPLPLIQEFPWEAANEQR